jgi:hypothetical protein
MRIAVVDNSTLTAVQRLLGEIEIENTVSIDGDIAAFETLIQSILFYEQSFTSMTTRNSFDPLGALLFIVAGDFPDAA